MMKVSLSAFYFAGVLLSLASTLKNQRSLALKKCITSNSQQRLSFSLLSQNENIPKSDETSFFYSKRQFEDIGVSKLLHGVVNALNLARPSKIQALAFQSILRGNTCIVADQTGSGKTLAYLLPVIQRVMEQIRNGTLPLCSSRAPYVVVITPTTELAYQVAKVVKSVAQVLKFRTACVTSTSDMDSEQKKLRLGSEILISTPGRLLALLKREQITLENVQTIILDEADVLFMDQSFPLQPIGEAAAPNAQFIFTTATLPDIVTDQIKQEFPMVECLTGPGLHRIAPTVEEVLVDCTGPSTQEKSPETAFENKRLALLRAIEQNPCERTLIFCNTINQCRNVENVLNRADRQGKLRMVYAYHGAVDSDTREDAIVQFSRRLLKVPVVLVCTDRASRGMDFDASPVDHVILFDFPQEPSEYVRRVGRTGRAGRFGRVTVLVVGRQVAVAKQAIGASMAGKRIEPVPEMGKFELPGGGGSGSGGRSGAGAAAGAGAGFFGGSRLDSPRGNKRKESTRDRGNKLKGQG